MDDMRIYWIYTYFELIPTKRPALVYSMGGLMLAIFGPPNKKYSGHYYGIPLFWDWTQKKSCATRLWLSLARGTIL